MYQTAQNNSFDESPYLGPSGLNLGLQNPSISVSQGLCQLQVRNLDQTEVSTGQNCYLHAK